MSTPLDFRAAVASAIVSATVAAVADRESFTLADLAAALGIQREAAAARMKAVEGDARFVVSKTRIPTPGKRGAPPWHYRVSPAPAAGG